MRRLVDRRCLLVRGLIAFCITSLLGAGHIGPVALSRVWAQESSLALPTLLIVDLFSEDLSPPDIQMYTDLIRVQFIALESFEVLGSGRLQGAADAPPGGGEPLEHGFPLEAAARNAQALDQALALYHHFKFREARHRLAEFVQQVLAAPRPEWHQEALARAHLYLGMTALATKDAEGARQPLERALQLAPSLEVGSPQYSPLVRDAVGRARGGLAGAATGRLTLVSIPSAAELHVNGTHRGNTPLTLEGVTPGSYQLEVRHPGYRVHRDSLIVERARWRLHTVHLQPEGSPAVERLRAAALAAREAELADLALAVAAEARARHVVFGTVTAGSSGPILSLHGVDAGQRRRSTGQAIQLAGDGQGDHQRVHAAVTDLAAWLRPDLSAGPRISAGPEPAFAGTLVEIPGLGLASPGSQIPPPGAPPPDSSAQEPKISRWWLWILVGLLAVGGGVALSTGGKGGGNEKASNTGSVTVRLP